MAKKVYRILDDLSPSEAKLRNLPRKPDGLYNMHFNEYGQLEKRLGFEEYNADSIGASHPIKGLHRFYKMDTLDKTLLAAWNTNIYKFTIAPTATTWDVQYVCTVEPDAADPVWTLQGTDYASCADGILTIDTSAVITRNCSYYRSPDINFTSGFLVQFKAKMVSGEGTRPFRIHIFDGSQNKVTDIFLRTDSIYQSTWDTLVCTFDTTDDYHVYQIAIVDTIATLYIDGTYIGEWAVNNYIHMDDKIQFGDDKSANSCKIYIDYFYYTSDFTVAMTATSIKSELTADSDTYFADFYNHCYIVNGADTMMKYNLTNVRTVGITAPTAPTVNAIGVGGQLGHGVYYFICTYVDEDGFESNGSTASALMRTDTIVVENCEDAWNETNDAECTASLDEVDYKVGAGSAKFVFSADAEAGDKAATEVIASTDLSGCTSIKFWAKCSITTTAADFKIYLDDHAECVSPTETLDVPVLTADVWTECTVDLASPSSCTAIISIGLEYDADIGVCTLRLDDIKAVKTAPNNKITINIPVSGDAKIAKRRIYRTTADGSIYYYEGEVADNTTETYASITADATIALNDVLHTDHDAPPSDPHLIAKRRNRLFIGHDSELCISHLSDIEYFPAAWFIYTGNRGEVRGLMEAREDLAVLTDDTVERLTNYSEDSFEVHNTFSTEGCIAQRSLVNCDNLVCYLGFDGIYYFDGVRTRKLNYALNEYIKDNIVKEYAYLSCGIYWDDKYILCYPKTDGTYPTEAIYYDFVNRNYGVYSLSFSCFSKWDKGLDGLQLKAGSNTAGRVYSVFSGLDDDGSAITCYDKPEPLDMGNPDIWKQFYHVYIKVKSTTGTALRFYYTLDDGTETYKDLTLTADKTLWYKIDLITGGQRARAIRLRPYVSDKYAVTYMGYAIVYEEEPSEYA